MSKKNRFCLKHAIAPFVLVVIIIAWHFPILTHFWLADDSQILKYAITYNPLEYFFIPDIWQRGTVSSFTPWVVFSFDIDWKLFGLRPFWFYLHHLMSLGGVAVAGYFMLKLWFPARLSFLGMLLFAASPAFAESTHLLMVRHYIEGLILSILSVYCFIRGVREENFGVSAFGAFLYLLSMSAKEIYAPLIGLLLFLPEAHFRRRLIHLLPWFIAIAFYVFWRRQMLGWLSGGVGYDFVWPQDILLFFPRIVDAMSGVSMPQLWWRVLIVISTLTSTILLVINRHPFFFTLFASLLFLLPIFPVSLYMATRYVWLISFGWIILHIVVWNGLRKWNNVPLVRICIFLWSAILFFGFFFSSLAGIESMKIDFEKQGKEGLFVLKEGSATDLLVTPGSPGTIYTGLLWLRSNILHLPNGPAVILDPHLFCYDIQSGNEGTDTYVKAWHFDSRNFTLISEDAEAFIRRACAEEIISEIRLHVPLSLHIHYDHAVISWEFGPYKEGSYALFFGEEAESIYQLPNKGKRLISLRRQSPKVRLRYISPHGWRTYSPILNLAIKNDQGRIQWQKE